MTTEAGKFDFMLTLTISLVNEDLNEKSRAKSSLERISCKKVEALSQIPVLETTAAWESLTLSDPLEQYIYTAHALFRDPIHAPMKVQTFS